MTQEEFKVVLKKINPKNGEKYSLNLFRFLKRNPQYHHAYRDREGVLYLGYLLEGLFHGQRIGQILSGSRHNYCYVGPIRWRELKGFWPKYLRIGRCLLDPKHTHDHKDRYQPVGKTGRQCQWCGAKMKLRRWTEKVKRSRWELV
jgi:hypothetical protein